MGRAARHKRLRRTSRPWTTTNPWTGARETFMVRLGDADLRAWERQRVALRAQGYADRPPDVVTDKVRGWTPAGQTAAPRALLDLDVPARAVGAWSAGGPGVEFEAHLFELEDGTLGLAVRAGRRERPQTYLAQVGPDTETLAPFLQTWAARYGLSDLRYTPAGPGSPASLRSVLQPPRNSLMTRPS